MKEFLKIVMVAGIAFVISCLTIAGFHAIPVLNKKAKQKAVIDDAAFASYIDRTIDPEFTNISDVMSYKQVASEREYVDSVFNALPTSILTNVVPVCLKKYNLVKKRTIVQEYMKNRDIYTALPQPTESVASPSAKEEQRVTTVETPVFVKDTVIDGITYRRYEQ